MSNEDFQQVVLEKLTSLETQVSSLKTKIENLEIKMESMETKTEDRFARHEQMIADLIRIVGHTNAFEPKS